MAVPAVSYGEDPRAEERRLVSVLIACRSLGLRRSDRLEVATVLLDRNVETFKSLSSIEVDRLWYAFHGAVYVANLLWERHKGTRV